MIDNSETLTFRDGRTVTFDEAGSDESVLRMRHTCPRPTRLAGPHWHPVLRERFAIVRGIVVFRLDGRELRAEAGDVVDVPARVVHAFRSTAPDLVMDHEVRPPMRHRRMFELWHELDVAGRTSGSGLPRSPLDLARLWSLQDGYLAGVPVWSQRLVLGTLARFAGTSA